MLRTADRHSPRSVLRLCAALAVIATAVACGKKGPPLAPLNLVPERPATIAARVVGHTVYLTTVIPSKNANGPGTVAIDHLELYAVTAAAGAFPPPNRDLLTDSRAVAGIPVRPPPDPDAPLDDTAPADTRPAPGDQVTFAEPITQKELTPAIEAQPEPPAPPKPTTTMVPPSVPPSVEVPTSPEAAPASGVLGGGTTTTSGAAGVSGAQGSGSGAVAPTPETTPSSAGGAAAAPAAAGAAAASAAPAGPAKLTVPTRFYVVRGIAKKGRPGNPSSRVAVPLVPAPAAPSAPTVTFQESGVTVHWTAQPGGDTATKIAYNVYPADQAAAPAGQHPAAPTPLNAEPIDGTSFDHAGAEPGKEQCFVLRAVERIDDVNVESEASPRGCVTPKDIFPPAAPKALAAVAGAGAINLIWDANSEADLAGYLVLRAEGTGDTLQPITPQPVKDTRYADSSARPGTQYTYAVVAVDKAGNRSPLSNKVTETAR